MMHTAVLRPAWQSTAHCTNSADATCTAKLATLICGLICCAVASSHPPQPVHSSFRTRLFSPCPGNHRGWAVTQTPSCERSQHRKKA